MPVGPIVQHWETGLDKFKSRYSLDVSGVAGLFGSELVIAAMSSIPICPTRRWLGWHNTPGSYDVARKYGVLARASVWDGLFPGENVEPSEVFREIVHKNGPAFYGVRPKPSKLKTGHFGYLLMQECRNRVRVARRVKSERRRGAVAVAVTVVELSDLAHDLPVPLQPINDWYTVLAVIPIMTTILACIMCALVNDWVCLALIAFGALAHGLSCLLMGLGRVNVTTDTEDGEDETTSHESGILVGDGSHIVILLGKSENRAIKTIIHGGFSFELYGEPEYHWIGYSAVLLTAQFFLQLILIPLATLYGQLMFIASLAASWLHTAILSSSRIRDRLEQEVIEKQVFEQPIVKTKYMFESRAAMAVFTLLNLRGHSPSSPSGTPGSPVQGGETLNVKSDKDTGFEKALDQLVRRELEPVSSSSSSTSSSSPARAWARWKEIVLPQILNLRYDKYELTPEDRSSLGLDNCALLTDLLEDHKTAFAMYQEITRRPASVMTAVQVHSLSSDAHHDASPDGSKFA